MLEIHSLSKTSWAAFIVDNFSLKAFPGEIICVQCPNHSDQADYSKEFCEILVGLRRQSAGSISIDTYDMTFEPEMAKRLIGYVPKDRPQSISLTGRELLHLTEFLYHSSADIDKVPTEAWLDSYINDYSKEQRLTLSLLAALLHKPKLLLLDRPFDRIDKKTIESLTQTLKDFAEKKGIVIFTTDDQLNNFSNIYTRTILLGEAL